MQVPTHDDPLDDPLEIDRYTCWQTAGSQRTAVSALQVSGMHCAACAGLIEQAVSRVDGVIAAQVNAAARRLSITWDPARTRPSALVAAVRAAGYGAVPDTASSARELRRDEHRAAVWRLFVAAFCGMQVMMMATPSYVASGNELAPDLRQLLNWGSWVLSIPVMWFGGMPFVQALPLDALAETAARLVRERGAAFERFKATAQQRFPQLQWMACTQRQALSVDHHALGALLLGRDGTRAQAPVRQLQGIVDRIGGGDAFAAGILHGILSGLDAEATVRFGLAAGGLKHSIPGDFNPVSEADVLALVGEERFDVRR